VTATTKKHGRPALRWLAQAYLTLILAPLIVLLIVRIVMTPAFLYFEYTRPGFPDDPYGFTTEERMDYAPYTLRYLLNGEDVEYLADLTLNDGRPMYTLRELQHLRDVKIVTQIAFAAAIGASVLALVVVLYLYYRGDPWQLATSIRNGALFTVALLITIALTAVFNWEFFFTGFHQMFFASGTWQFYYSDTLIRLFPEQFWFDAALTIGGLTILSAITLFFITYRVKSA